MEGMVLIPLTEAGQQLNPQW